MVFEGVNLIVVCTIKTYCYHMNQIDILKEQLNGEFEMKDLGLAKKILGIELIKNRKKGTLFLTQKKYV